MAVIAAGLSATTAAAREVARADGREERHAFEATAAEIAGSLHRSIERHQDLVVSAAALVTETPGLSTGGLSTWLDAVRARQRYPELLAVGLVTVVPHGDLESFVDQQREDIASEIGSTASLDDSPAW